MLSLIVAISSNNVIGKNNDMPWHLPDDLKRFKKITQGKTIIMGRVTFESLPKILPDRYHIVITKSETINDENVKTDSDLDKILNHYKNAEEEAFIIGGAKIYNASLNYCDKVYITRIYKDFDGDTFLNLDLKDFSVTDESEQFEFNGMAYKFIDYKRI